MPIERRSIAFCLILLLAAQAPAGTLRTRDGKTYEGDIHLDKGAFVVRVADGPPVRVGAADVAQAIFVDAMTSPHGLKANIYSGLLFQDLRLTRIDPKIDFALNGQNPAPDTPPQSCCIRWTGLIQPRYSETYTFRSIAASGFQFWIEDKPVIMDWTNRGAPGLGQGKIPLVAGHKYKVLAEFFSNTGEAQAHLYWSSPSEIEEIVPPQCLIPAARTAADDTVGLRGEYFADTTLQDRKLGRIDPRIDFQWGGGSPDPAVPAEHFSVRWTGQIIPRRSENYTFTLALENGARLWVNGKQIINDWRPQGAHEVVGLAPLLAGQAYDIKLEYFSDNGHAAVQLFWTNPHQPRELVPTRSLVPAGRSTAPSPATAPATNWAEPERSTGLVLCDGSVLAGSVQWNSNQAAILYRKPREQIPGQMVKPQRQPLRVPQGEVAVVILSTPNAEQLAKLLSAPPGALMAAGDFVEGEVKAINGSNTEIDSILFGRTTVPRGQLIGVVMRAIKRTGACEVRTKDGVRLIVPSAAALTMESGRLVLDQPTLGKLSLDEDELYSVTAVPPEHPQTPTTKPE